MPDFSLERQSGRLVAGVDEAGRGPWAGPVVAAAVIFRNDPERHPDPRLCGLDDSKALSRAAREGFYAALRESAWCGIGAASVGEIDGLNILQASFLAMRRAIAALPMNPDALLIDGNRLPAGLDIPARAIIKGDSLSLSIAAASVLAKVTRDSIMARLARRHPGFGWEKNAGYGTKAHREAIARLGLTAHHRMSFKPIKMLSPGVTATRIS